MLTIAASHIHIHRHIGCNNVGGVCRPNSLGKYRKEAGTSSSTDCTSLLLFHAINAKTYPQVVRCNPPAKRIILYPGGKKNLDVGDVVDVDHKVIRRKKLASGHAKFGDRT